MQDNKSISRDGTDKQNLPYSLGRFWPLWELKAISGWPLLAASVVKGLIKYFYLFFTAVSARLNHNLRLLFHQ